jgi:arylsulfatase A-like enzyme
VKRHYGIRTERFKLIHFYYDIDAWELYDLQADPHELRNLYSDPKYAQTVADLKAELAQLRRKYKDTDEKKFLPQPGARRGRE